MSDRGDHERAQHTPPAAPSSRGPTTPSHAEQPARPDNTDPDPDADRTPPQPWQALELWHAWR